MNYIKHLTGFFNKSNQDKSISHTHISLYLALFQRWNLNRFKTPIIISREEMMNNSKIKSKGTYHKCMKELHKKSYIIYKPSFNPYEGTEVLLPDLSDLLNIENGAATSSNNEASPNFDTSSNFDQSESNNELPESDTSSNFDCSVPNNELLTSKNGKKEDASSNFDQSESNNELPNTDTRLKNERTKSKNSQVDEQVYIDNNKTYTNTINKDIESKSEILNSKNSNTAPEENQEEKNCAKKEEENNNGITPSIEMILEYFVFKESSEIEANKFFNYYSSIGWLVGGKTKMKDWKASARNWIMNQNKFQPKSNIPQPNHLQTSNYKNYAEPL